MNWQPVGHSLLLVQIPIAVSQLVVEDHLCRVWTFSIHSSPAIHKIVQGKINFNAIEGEAFLIIQVLSIFSSQRKITGNFKPILT